MKIRITNEAKQWMTLAEAPEAKKIINVVCEKSRRQGGDRMAALIFCLYIIFK